QGAVNRNHPCPCGSGRRYKDCHGTVDNAKAPPDVVFSEQVAPSSDTSVRDADQWHAQGLLQFDRGEFVAAAKSITKAIASDAKRSLFHRDLARALLGAGIADEAA